MRTKSSRRRFGYKPAAAARSTSPKTSIATSPVPQMRIFGYGLGEHAATGGRVELVQVAAVGGDIMQRRAVVQRIAPDAAGRVWEYVPAGLATHPADPSRAGWAAELSNHVSLVLSDALTAGAVIYAYTDDHRHFVLAPSIFHVEVVAA